MHSFNSLIPMSPEAMKVFSNVKYDMFDYIYVYYALLLKK